MTRDEQRRARRFYALLTIALFVVACVVVTRTIVDAIAAPAGYGQASSYGPGLYGNHMACGGRLYPSTHAVAHRTLPCGTWLKVCHRNRCQRLLVRDRGPFVGGRELDITEAAVRRFGYGSSRAWGVRWVRWTVMYQ